MTFTTTGTGTFVYNGTEYTPGEVIPVTKGSSNGQYIGTTGGAHDVVFTVTNQDAKSKSATVKLNYINNDFTLSSSGDGTLNINSTKAFNLFLSQQATDNAITYEVKFTIASGSVGNGTLSKAGTAVPYGTFQTIAKGTTEIVFNGTAEGIVNITAEVKGSNGITHSTTLNFSVKAITYNFSGASQANTINLGANTPLTFDITETAASGTAYELKYELQQGNAEIRNGARPMTVNQWESVNVGSFNRTFIGTTAGTVKVLFTVRNKITLVEKTQLITIVVNPSDFTFTASGTSNNELSKTPVNVNFNVNQVGGGTDTYKMTFTTTGTGKFEYESVTYTAGQVIPFHVGASNGKYIGTTSGAHDIIFTVTNQDAKSKSATVKLTYVNNDFVLSTSGDGSLNISQSKDFNIFLSQNTPDNAITYEVKYTIATGSVGNGTLSKAGTAVTYGTYQPISKGTSLLVFKGTAAGKVNITVEVKDSNGVVHTSLLQFDVKAISYTFTGAAQYNSIFVNGSNPITFDITETAPSGTDYEIKYSLVQGNAEIKNGSLTMTANQWQSVNVGSFNRTFVGTTVGTVKVLFTVRNKITLVEKSETITVVVNPSEFTFNATRANNDQVVNTQTNINFNLTQTGGTSDTYYMTFTTSSTGTFTYNGIEYTAGENIPFVIGASTGSYKGTKAGKHDLVFTVANQINISKKSDVSISFINNDYTLSSSGDGSMFLNQTKDFSVFLAQLLPDPSISYEVKYSFDSGTTGKGTITQNGNPVSLGSYEPIGLGTSSLIFKGTTAGNIYVLVEVKNSNGLFKSSVIMFQVKNTEFTFTGGAQSNQVNVGESTTLNFDVTEAVSSGTDYEMSYSLISGNVTISSSGTTIYANQWNPIQTGSFARLLSVTGQGNISLIFTVRNKMTLQTKTVPITISAYQKPTPIDIYTSLDFFDRGGGHEDQWRWYLHMQFLTQSGATITSVVFTVAGETFNLSPTSVLAVPYGQEFKYIADNRSRRDDFNLKPYSIKLTDSNGVTTTTTGIWRNNEW